jgi:predicted permease
MDTFLRDIRFGLKLLWKEKAFSATVLLTLAVCIGANTTIFSVINTVLLQPLPYEEAHELVTVFNSYPGAGVDRASNGAPDFFFRRDEVSAFDEVANYRGSGNTIGEAGSVEQITSLMVSSTFLDVLRVRPIRGRNFTWEEMEPGNHQKVILSYSFWRDRYGGEESVLDRDLRVDGVPYLIVGVLPESFRVAGRNTQPELLLPNPFSPEERTLESWHSNNYAQIARLAPGATVEQARSQVAALNERLIEEWPLPDARQLLDDAGFHTQIHPAKEDMLRDVKPSLLMLWAGVAFVLLIGCVNIANLMLARSNVRMRELATRLALGADRTRLGRQLLTEAVLLGFLGGALGLLLGYAGLQTLGSLGVDSLPRGTEISLDLPVLVFTLLLGLGAGVVFGSIPLIHVMRSDLNAVFRAESRSGTAGRGSVLLRSGLVTGQVAIAFILLIGAGLMLRSFRAVLDVEPGFDPEGVVAGYVALPNVRYPEAQLRAQFARELLEGIRALSAVEFASLTTQLPFSGNQSSSVILPEGYIPPPGESVLSPYQNWVGTDYFAAMEIPLLEGRVFDSRDDAGGEQVIILDEWLANRYFPDESPVGKRMLWGTVPGAEEDQEDNLFTVVGVVGSHRQNDMVESQFVGSYWFPLAQAPRLFMTLLMKTDADPTTLVEPARAVISDLDPEVPFFSVMTLQERIDDSLVARRAPMLLLMVFAGVALFLAGVGVYGALAYSVTQRTREMGIRVAMGSDSKEVFRLVVGQGLKVVGLGLVVGILGALGLVRLIQSLLYGVQPTDPWVLASVAGLMAATGLLACLLPARRATRIDPVVALTGD